MPKQIQKSMAQFRTSSHQLKIETGRHDKIPATHRFCDFCNNGEVDDELHMLLKCEYHVNDRKAFLCSITTQSSNSSLSDLFEFIMSCKDPETVVSLANFIHKCFQSRKNSKLLS